MENSHIENIKNELKILRNDLIQFFSDINEDDINDEFYNKLIDYSSQNPEFLSVLKLLTILSSKNETELKHYKIKIYKILEKIINLKEKSLDVLALQQELFNDIQKTISEMKENDKKSIFLEVIKTITKSKILAGVLSFLIIVFVVGFIKDIDSVLYKDILDILKKFHF